MGEARVDVYTLCAAVVGASANVTYARQVLANTLKAYQVWDAESRFSEERVPADRELTAQFTRSGWHQTATGQIEGSNLEAYRTIEPELTRAQDIVIMIEKRAKRLVDEMAKLPSLQTVPDVVAAVDAADLDLAEPIKHADLAAQYARKVARQVSDALPGHWSQLPHPVRDIVGKMFSPEPTVSTRLAPHLNTGVADAVTVAGKKLTALVGTLEALATTVKQAGEDFGSVA
ncbi:MAG TPA: hypothetical protein VIP77_09770 [Jiangellaceae bacterium]